MFPYQFDPIQPEQQPAAPPVPASGGRARRLGIAGVLVLALSLSALGGGAAGTVAATHWLLPQRPTVTAPLMTAQPVVAQGAPASSVAGAVFSAAGPAVVRVTVAGQARSGVTPSGNGSGFVVDPRGLILTNYHVVANAQAVSVRFSTGEVRKAQLLGTDRGNDLALLTVDLPAGVPVVRLGDSDQVEVGETVVAIGSPFGLDQTVTQGIVSAVGRTWQPRNGQARRGLIQTDAPINPGNSGGPLLNARGEVIGITSMIESPVAGSVGVGFAIPINTAKRLLSQLEAGARLEPVWLGITAQELDPALARDRGLTVQTGILVGSVLSNGPAAQAGLRAGDVITAIDGRSVRTMAELADRLSGYRPGDSITVTINRAGQEQQVPVTLQAWPADAP
jgi:S1-C subfamily serine protease